MLIHINPNDGLPIYRQIVRQVKHALASGVLTSGDKLPSQRELAHELVISHLTVKKAYDVLESEGIIRTERGRGTFVAARPPARLRRESADRIRKRLAELTDSARLLGMRRETFVQLLERIWPTDEESNQKETVREHR